MPELRPHPKFICRLRQLGCPAIGEAKESHAADLRCFRTQHSGSIPTGPASFPALSTQCTFVGMEFASTNTNSAPFIIMQPVGFGLLFKFVANGALTNVIAFNGTNGTSPQAPLVQGAEGNLYGTTLGGGTFDNGTIFQVAIAPTPPVIRTVSNSNGTLTLTWSALAGRTYQLQYLTNLQSVGWSNLGGVITATNNRTVNYSTGRVRGIVENGCDLIQHGRGA